MADPATWAIAITAVSAAAAGTAAYAGQQQQNRTARRARQSARVNAAIQSQQVKAAMQLEKQKIRTQAELIRGRIRANAAAAGFEDVGTYTELQRQASVDAALNTEIVQKNAQAQLARVASGLSADLTQLGAGIQSPVLSAFTASLSGARTGLAISNELPKGSGGNTSAGYVYTGQGPPA